MSSLQNHLWKFTIVHRLSLVETPGVVVFGQNLQQAQKHLFDLFPKAFFQIKEGHIISNRHFVGILSYQFPEDLL